MDIISTQMNITRISDGLPDFYVPNNEQDSFDEEGYQIEPSPSRMHNATSFCPLAEQVINGFRVCFCCDDSMVRLAALNHEHRLEELEKIHIKKEYVKEDLQSMIREDSYEKPLRIVEECCEFLACKKFLQSDASLLCFITKDLGIQLDSGFDYWLMSYLTWEGLTEHGSSLRCSWLERTDGVPVSEEMKARVSLLE